MKKRQLILNDYKTAEDGLWTLASCKITKAAQTQTFVKVPGRFAPLDFSTVLTDGEPYYGNASLKATLESSEGTRAERQERIDHMVNLLDGRSMKIVHPDFPGRHLVGRVQVTPNFNGLAYCSVALSAVLEPWLYNDDETTKEALLPYAEVSKIGGMTYKEGDTLKSAPVTEVESVGANVFGGDVLADKLVNECNAVKNESVGTVTYSAGDVHKKVLFEDFKPNTRYTIILKGNNNSDTQAANLAILYTDGTYETQSFLFTNGTIVAHSADGKSIESFCGYWNTSNTTLYYKECGVFEGVLNESDFSPYVRNTLPIPEAVQALDGYGDGMNESVYNYIDWEKKQFVKHVEKFVFDGSDDEIWLVQQYTNLTAYFDDCRFGLISHGSTLNLKCDSFREYPVISSQPNGTVGVAIEGLNYSADSFFFGISGIASDVSEWKAYLANNPVTVVYELATPIITDISDILSDDNFIGVEAGGTVTFKNPHEYAVPSEITFYVDSTAGVLDSSVAYTKDVPGTATQEQEIVLKNEGRLATVPIVEVVGEVSLTYGGKTRALRTGAYQLPDLYLTTGEHRVRCEGKGTVTITYREAVLAG